MMDSLWQDIRYGARSLMRSPGFTLVVVLAMALGIGVTTMIFTVVNAILLRPAGLPQEDRLVMVYGTSMTRGENRYEMAFPDYEDYLARAKSFESMSAYYEGLAYVTIGDQPQRFDATVATPGLFRTLGAGLTLGREFEPHEGVWGSQYGVVIISHKVWTEKFGADPGVLGRTIKINGRVREIVGVGPRNIRFPENADFFQPLARDPKEDQRGARYLDVVGRLRADATLATAGADVRRIAAEIARDHKGTNENMSARAVRYREALGEDIRPMMLLLMSAVVFVLLIAIANVANLMLARAATRHREIALRMALGAGRRRIARQLLTEAVLVALAGAAVGWVLADWGMQVTLASIPEEFPFWMNFAPDARVLLFTIGISVASGLLFGLAPLAQISHVQLNESLKEGGHAGIGSRSRARLRNGLVIAEIALALVLLVSAGLMARSFVAMSQERTQLDPRGVLTGIVTLPVATYPDDAARLAFFDAVMPRIAGLPGVTAASGSNVLPLGRSSWTRSLMIEGQEYKGDEDHPVTSYGVIRPDYFRSIGIPLRSGRDFNTSDVHRGAAVAIVNESAAKTFWKDRDPIGMRLKFDADSAGWRTVVGVVADVRQHVHNTSRPVDQVFVPHTQDPHQTLILTVRADTPMGPLTAAVREILLARDPDLPFYEVRSLEEHLRIALWDQQLFAVLMSVFAGLALLIAAVGIYGVMAYTVAQRTQEIGIRMALGAEQGKVLGMVVGQALKLAGIGVAIGLAGAFALTRLMAGLLFGVRPDDPPTFAVVTVLLALSAVIAAWIPARRAARVDPMVALRCE